MNQEERLEKIFYVTIINRAKAFVSASQKIEICA